jgi:hypothetical protein
MLLVLSEKNVNIVQEDREARLIVKKRGVSLEVNVCPVIWMRDSSLKLLEHVADLKCSQ